MKKDKLLKLICSLLFFLPFHSFAQQDITGLWKGQLYNDTTKQYLYYELVISDDKGKLSGYSYTVFKGDKGDETGVKTVKVKIKDDKIIIEDISLIDNTYIVDVSVKKVRKLATLTLTVKDSMMVMKGTWMTNWIGKYRPVTGTIEIQKKTTVIKDEPLIKKLDEMKLTDNLSFYKPEKKEVPVAVIDSKKSSSNQENVVEKITAPSPEQTINKQQPCALCNPDSLITTTTVIKPEKKIKKRGDPDYTVSAKKNAFADSIKKINSVVIPPPAAEAAIRKTETIQTIEYESDSLIFTIYDNGIVDGDTVSIVMNNNLIFAKAGLSEKPNTKTFYTKDIPDSTQLIWYAENLGTIPPNTGLLIIMDGKIRHEVFFSADLQTNAAIILRKKKKTG